MRPPVFDITKDTILCHVYNYIGFLIFFASTAKSIFDLIVSEFIHKDTPLNKMSWRKLFHFLLPLSQITFCISCFVFNMYCVAIKDQDFIHTMITSIGGYILALCFLINALHWAFLTSQSESYKMKGIIFGGIIFLFIIVPLTFEVLIGYYYYSSGKRKHKSTETDLLDMIHLVELIYASALNMFLCVVVFISWLILHRRLKEFSGLHTINKLKKRLFIQMSLYILFFLLRAICLLVIGITSRVDPLDTETWSEVRNSLFFFSALLGDVPLAFVMLYFLQHKKPSNTQQQQQQQQQHYQQQQYHGSGGSGGGSGHTHPQYQYTSGSRGDDNSPHLGGQIDPTNDIYYPDNTSGVVFTATPPVFYGEMLHGQIPSYPQNTPYYYSPQVGNMDPTTSTNSYYSAEGGFI